MPKTLRAVIRGGKIEPLEQVDLPEGSNVLATLVPDEEIEFWLAACQSSVEAV